MLKRCGLVVPFHEFAHQRDRVLRAVYPFDARAARVGVDAVAGEDHHRHAIAPCVVNSHRAVLQADSAVQHDAHRLARRLGIAMRDAGRGFFVKAGEDFGILVTGVIDDGFVQAAKSRCGIDRNVLEPDGFQYIRHEVGAGTRDESFARQFSGRFGRGLRAFGRRLRSCGNLGAGGHRGAGRCRALQKRAAI